MARADLELKVSFLAPWKMPNFFDYFGEIPEGCFEVEVYSGSMDSSGVEGSFGLESCSEVEKCSGCQHLALLWKQLASC